MKKRLVKRLMASVKCRTCGQSYGEDSIDVLGHSEDLWFLMILCPNCNSQCLVVAVVKEDKISDIITDLTQAEVEKFKNMDVIGADDVLDMHEFLKDFDGDILRLLE